MGNFNPSEHFKNRYHNDEEFRKRFIECVKKYNQSEKGKATRLKRALNKKATGYYKEYMIKRRAEAREKKICQQCLKRPARENKTMCELCIKIGKENYQKRKNAIQG